MSNISLAVFSNCTEDVLENPTIYDCLGSLLVAFQEQDFATLIVYVNPEPNIKSYTKYVNKLKKYGFYTVKVKSKEDAWEKAVKDCETDYLFVLEDDWFFDSDQIKHQIQDVTYWMRKNNIKAFKFNSEFNQRNENNEWETYFNQHTKKKFCLTNTLDSEPQILDVKRLKELAIIRTAQEAQQALTNEGVGVYGGYGKIKTVERIDVKKGVNKSD